MKTILCVEDNLKLLHNNRDMLIEDGYNVLTAPDLTTAREHLATTNPDIIVLDIMLPDGNGLEYLQELRANGCKIPIIMLTAWNRSNNIAHGLKLGANDYIGKPFDYEVLLARIEALFRNIEQIPEFIVKDRITLKIRSLEVHFGNDKIKFSPVEFFLLQLLIENEGTPLKAEYIYEQVWGDDMNNEQNAVKGAVLRIRNKIKGSGYNIANAYGVGYSLVKIEK